MKAGAPVTIWHNPKCSTSRKVLEALRAAGHAPAIVDYQKSPPSRAEIAAVLKAAGLRARDLMRQRGTPYAELGLDDSKLTETQLIAAMAEYPILIERPVVQTSKGARLCRPPERWQEIL